MAVEVASAVSVMVTSGAASTIIPALVPTADSEDVISASFSSMISSFEISSGFSLIA